MLTFALTIVRHGETQYNRDKLLQGQGIDTPLSDTGHQQAATAGQFLKDLRFTNVFVSNLQRAVQTAEIILGNNLHSSETEMILDPLRGVLGWQREDQRNILRTWRTQRVRPAEIIHRLAERRWNK